MEKLISSINEAFAALAKHPNNDKEIAEIIKELLNNYYDGKIYCNKVFITKGNGTDPFVVSVIPRMLKMNFIELRELYEYDIDIDISSFNTNYNKDGLTSMEMTAWLVHELFANIITDDTLLRFKKLLVKHLMDSGKKVLSKTPTAIGLLLWIGIFSRTKKQYSNDSNNPIMIMMNEMSELNIPQYWDSALSSYIRMTGGNLNILTDRYYERMDMIQLKKFNELARKYTSDSVKFNNTDWPTFAKYLDNYTNSSLLKYYINAEPKKLILFKEKDVYSVFDDTSLFREDASNLELMQEPSPNELLAKTEELAIDIKNIETGADKLVAVAKTNDLAIDIDKKIVESNGQPSQIVRLAKNEIERLKKDVVEVVPNTEISVVEI